MKTIKFICACFLVTTTLFLTSCSNDDDGGGTPSGFYLQANVEGENYSNSDFFEPSGILVGGTLNIQSSDNSGNSIQIQIPNFDGEGTYNSGNNDLLAGYINYLEAGATLGQFTSFTSVRGEGQVIVTSATETQIEGTFTAEVIENVDGSTNGRTITNGSFRIEL